MLYDKRWDQKTKANPFTLPSLIAWLETQPENKRYDYGCQGTCMLAQYFIAQGFKGVWVGGLTCKLNGKERDIPRRLNDVAVNTPYTFGAALERARKLAA